MSDLARLLDQSEETQAVDSLPQAPAEIRQVDEVNSDGITELFKAQGKNPADMEALAKASGNEKEFYSKIASSLYYSKALDLNVGFVWDHFDQVQKNYRGRAMPAESDWKAIGNEYESGWLSVDMGKEYNTLMSLRDQLKDAENFQKWNIASQGGMAGSADQTFSPEVWNSPGKVGQYAPQERDPEAIKTRLAETQARIDELKKKRDTIPVDLTDRGLVISAAKAAAQFMPSILDTMPAAVLAGVLTGGGSLIAQGGMAGVRAMGMKAATKGIMTAGAGAAQATGFAKGYQLEGGLAYGDMVEAGVPHEIASQYSQVIGAINGSLEMFQIGTMSGFATPATKGLIDWAVRQGTERAVNKGLLAAGAIRFASRWAAGTIENTAQEVAQEVSSIIFEEAAKALANSKYATDIPMKTWDETMKQLKDVAVGAFLGSAALGLPGAMVSSMDGKARVRAEKVAKDLEGVDPRIVAAQLAQVVENPEHSPEEAFLAKQETEPTILSTDGVPDTYYTAGTSAEGIKLYRSPEEAAHAADQMTKVPSPQAVLEAIKETYGPEVAKLAQEGQGEAAAILQAAQDKVPAWDKFHEVGIKAESPAVAVVHADVQDAADFVQDESGNVILQDARKVVPIDTIRPEDVIATQGAKIQAKAGTVTLQAGDTTVEGHYRDTSQGTVIDSLPENPNHARAILKTMPQAKLNIPQEQLSEILDTKERRNISKRLDAVYEAQGQARAEYAQATDKDTAKADLAQKLEALEAEEGDIIDSLIAHDSQLVGEDTLQPTAQTVGETWDTLARQMREAAPDLTEEMIQANIQLMDIRANAMGMSLDQWTRSYLGPDPFRAGTAAGNRGMVQFDQGRAVITFAQSADPTTFVHEFGHIIRRQLADEDQKILLAHYGSEVWDVKTEEAFAADWESVFLEGKIAPKGIEAIFRKIVYWFRKVYGSIRREVAPEVRAVIDRAFIQDGARVGIPQADIEAELYQYIGEKALLSDIESQMLITAKKMDEAGKDSETIRLATGWFKGKYDGRWRLEIPEINLKDKVPLEDITIYDNTYYNEPSGTLDQFIEAPDLFNKYPELKNIIVSRTMSDSVMGEYRPGFISLGKGMFTYGKKTQEKIKRLESRLNEILDSPEVDLDDKKYIEILNKNGREAASAFYKSDEYLAQPHVKEYINIESEINRIKQESTISGDISLNSVAVKILAHEIQHAIQEQEGFALGGNTNTKGLIIKYHLGQANKTREKIKEAENKLESMEYMSAEYTKLNSEIYDMKARIDNEARYDAYTRIAGEIEARDIESRISMSPIERRKHAPYSSENIAIEDATILYQPEKPTKFEAARLEKEIELATKGMLPSGSPVTFGKTPLVLHKIGFEAYELIMNQKKLKDGMRPKTEEHGHELTAKDYVNAQAGIWNPVYILQSDTVPGAVVVVTEEKDSSGDYLIASINPDKIRHNPANVITSVYGKSNLKSMLERSFESEMVIYRNTNKETALLQTIGVQFPKVAYRAAKNKYITQDDVFKSPDTLFQPAGDTSSPEFKAWFGDSVVTEDGKPGGTPLVVYHGTENVFDEFSKELVGTKISRPGGWQKDGFWFSPNKDIVSRYGKNIMEVYLKIERPAPSYHDFLTDEKYDRFTHEKAAIVREPTQIKSVNNTGTWNPEDPRILFQPSIFAERDRNIRDQIAFYEAEHLAGKDRSGELAELRSRLEDNRAAWREDIHRKLDQGEAVESAELAEFMDDPRIDQAAFDAFMNADSLGDSQDQAQEESRQGRTRDQILEDFKAELPERLQKIKEISGDKYFGRFGQHDRRTAYYMLQKAQFTKTGKLRDSKWYRDKQSDYDQKYQNYDADMEESQARDGWSVPGRIRFDLDLGEDVKKYLESKQPTDEKGRDLLAMAVRAIEKRLEHYAWNMAYTSGDFDLMAELWAAELADPEGSAALEAQKTAAIERRQEVKDLSKANAIQRVEALQERLAGRTLGKMTDAELKVLDRDIKAELKKLNDQIQQQTREIKYLDTKFDDAAAGARKYYDQMRDLEKQKARGDKQAQRQIEKLKAERKAALEAARAAGRDKIAEVKTELHDVTKSAREEARMNASTIKTQAEEKKALALAELRELYTVKEKKLALARLIMKKPGKNIDATYAIHILDMQEFFSGVRNLQRAKTIQRHIKLFAEAQPQTFAMLPIEVQEIVLSTRVEAWTVDQLEALHMKIETLRSEGKRVHAERTEAEKQAVASIVYKLRKSLEAQNAGASMKGAKIREEGSQAKNMLLAITDPQMVFDTLDGKQEYRGAFMTEIHNAMADKKAQAYEKILERKAGAGARMKALGLKSSQRFDWLMVNGKPVTITQGGHAYRLTMEEATGIYMLSQNEKSMEALTEGNKLPMKLIDQVKEGLPQEWKALGDWIIEHGYGDHTDRLADVYYRLNNEFMGREERYSPMVRRDVSGSQLAEDMKDEIARRNMQKKTPQKGFTQARIKIGKRFQSAIRIDSLTLYDEMVEKQEIFMNMAPMVRRMNNVLGKSNPELKTAIANTHGAEYLKYLNEWLSRTVNTSAPRSAFERFIMQARGNLSAAMLGYQVGSAIKQVSGLALTIGEMKNPLRYLASIPGTLSTFKKSYDEMTRLSPELARRVMDPSVFTANSSHSKLGFMAMKFRDAGFAMQQWMDTLTVTTGWTAMYQENLSRGMSEAEAVREATNAINRTQPTSDPMENSPIMADRGAIAAFTGFGSATSKIWNNLAHLPDFRRGKEVARYMLRVGSIALSALAFATIGNLGWPDDDDEEKKQRFWTGVMLDSSFGTFPVFGGPLKTSITGYDAKFPMLAGVFDAVKKIANINEGMTDQQVFSTMDSVFEAGSLLTGAPYLQLKRLFTGLTQEDNTIEKAMKQILFGKS